MQAVEKLGYQQPTPIQQQAIPALLAGRDVIGQAQTGTGKTAAYALPMLQGLQSGRRGIQALVLAPTRELAIQVAEATTGMAEHTQTRILSVYGGQSYHIQVSQLQRGVDVVVGTPGRMLDLMRQNLLDLRHVRYLVLDEADEMLEMGFIDDVETIMEQIPGDRQIALFSATLPDAVRKLAGKYLADPEKISINPERRTVAETEQRYVRVRDDDKLTALARILETEDVKSALIFARTKVRAQELADSLVRSGYPAEALHGDLVQTRREMVLNRFRQHAITLLVATDVAARGLDIEDVSHVFNYDLPQDAEDYVHRIGRTGRAGRKGVAITFLTPRERSKLGYLEAYTHQPMKEMRLPNAAEVQQRRDERFVERLTAQLGTGSVARERALLAKLAESGLDALDLAAAAIQMARGSESSFAMAEIAEPAPQRVEKKIFTDARPKRGITRKGWQNVEEIPGAHGSRPQESGMVRLRMNLGETHGLRPRDVVGAIASEVGIPGQAIGSIEIREHYSFVDVAEKHVNRVLRESGGKYFLRGKPVMLTLAS
jgi:ATP-dependent RNA helicase DeaD